MRTDVNNNPTAMTIDVAKEGGLEPGVEYQVGTPFTVKDVAGGERTLYTAALLGDPIALTIKVIDKAGFYTIPPNKRWEYIALPYRLWQQLTPDQKKLVIGFMYSIEGGTAMKHLFES